mgnify:FL=1
METLNEREYRIICERRLGEENVTLECLGKKLGISNESYMSNFVLLKCFSSSLM